LRLGVGIVHPSVDGRNVLGQSDFLEDGAETSGFLLLFGDEKSSRDAPHRLSRCPRTREKASSSPSRSRGLRLQQLAQRESDSASRTASVGCPISVSALSKVR
jgi:hypothetical protein